MSGIRGYDAWPGGKPVVEWPQLTAGAGGVLEVDGAPPFRLVEHDDGRPVTDGDKFAVAVPDGGAELTAAARKALRAHTTSARAALKRTRRELEKAMHEANAPAEDPTRAPDAPPPADIDPAHLPENAPAQQQAEPAPKRRRKR